MTITFTFDPDGEDVARGPVDIDDVLYFMDYRYDARNDRWRLDISDKDNVLLAAGIKLVTYIDLLIPFTDPRLPTGELYATRLEGEISPVTKGDLGTKVFMIYITAEEIDIMETAALVLREKLPPTGVAI